MLENEERLEKLRQISASGNTASALPSQLNALSFVVPTEHVLLPSRGKFYSPDHPLYNQETIEIKQMTTKEEDILVNKSLIKKGIVIERLLESIIIDKRVSPSSILTGDRNAILIAARSSGYGSEYDVSNICVSCGNKKTTTINLSEFLEQQTVKLDEKLQTPVEGAERLENGNVIIKLPKTKWSVECRLLTGKDETYLMNLAEVKRRSSLSEDVTIAEQMLLMIVSIQNVTDKSTLTEAIKSLPASDAKYLRQKYQQSVPVFDMKYDQECEICNHQQEVEVGFNQEFFWPKR